MVMSADEARKATAAGLVETAKQKLAERASRAASRVPGVLELTQNLISNACARGEDHADVAIYDEDRDLAEAVSVELRKAGYSVEEYVYPGAYGESNCIMWLVRWS